MRQYLMKSGENVGERPTLLAVSGSTGVAWTTIRVRWCSEERLVGAVGWRAVTDLAAVTAFWFAWYAFHPDTSVFIYEP